MKPILFDTEMVRAILDGRKAVTRRAIKLPDGMTGRPVGEAGNKDNPLGMIYPGGIKRPPYQPGQILYVRETWRQEYDGHYTYRAGNPRAGEKGWRPSIYMPREAARIFLRVTDVEIERLQDIDVDGCKAEGIWDDYKTYSPKYHEALVKRAYPKVFADLWDSTIKPADRGKYGWSANPWVWVIKFERISKEEANV